MNKKKFKYGSLSILLTAVVIAVIILANVAITALFSSNLWYLYNVDGDIQEISELTDTLFAEKINPEKDKIEIVFLTDSDKVDDVSVYMKQIHVLAKQYEKRYEFITLKYIDYENDPQQWLKNYQKHENKSVTVENIIVKKAGSENAFKVLHINNFLVKDTATDSYYAFAGERRFTMSILSLYAGETVAYLTTGHGEVALDKLTEFKMILEETGFTVKTIDLAKEEIEEKADLIVIVGPTRDFKIAEKPGDVDEIDKLEAFCQRKGSVMAFIDPGTISKMESLRDFLSNYGMNFNNDIVYEDADHSLPGNSQSVLGTFVADGGVGSGLTAGVRDIENISVLLKMACTITINHTGSGFTDSADCSTKVSSVLCTSENAEKSQFLTGGEEMEKTEAPSADLMVLMERQWAEDDNTLISYMLGCGTSEFISDGALSGSYANDSILYTALRAMAEKNTPVDIINIEFVNYADTSLSITEGQANTWMVVSAVIIPVIILGTGIVIYFRRRHR